MARGFFVPENRRLATRVDVAPTKSRRHRELLQAQWAFGLELTFRHVVQVDPLGGGGETKGHQFLTGGATLERGIDGAVHRAVFGLGPKAVRGERATLGRAGGAHFAQPPPEPLEDRRFGVGVEFAPFDEGAIPRFDTGGGDVHAHRRAPEIRRVFVALHVDVDLDVRGRATDICDLEDAQRRPAFVRASAVDQVVELVDAPPEDVFGLKGLEGVEGAVSRATGPLGVEARQERAGRHAVFSK